MQTIASLPRAAGARGVSASVSALRPTPSSMPGEDQEQGGCKVPGKDEHCREQHDPDAADGDGQVSIGSGFWAVHLWEMVTSGPLQYVRP